MSVSQTSLLAYRGIEPNLTKREEQVLEVIDELGTACINDVAKAMNVYPNSISGRFTGLKRKDKIEFVERRVMPGRTTKADYYQVKGE